MSQLQRDVFDAVIKSIKSQTSPADDVYDLKHIIAKNRSDLRMLFNVVIGLEPYERFEALTICEKEDLIVSFNTSTQFTKELMDDIIYDNVQWCSKWWLAMCFN